MTASESADADGLEWYEAAAVLDAGFRLAQRNLEERGVIVGP